MRPRARTPHVAEEEEKRPGEQGAGGTASRVPEAQADVSRMPEAQT